MNTEIFGYRERWGYRDLTQEEMTTLLTEARIARICCHNPDGTIHASPVWYIYEDGLIKIAILRESAKARNIRLNPQVTVLVDLTRPARGVMMYGTAEFDTEDVFDKVMKIAAKYIPDPVRAKTMMDQWWKPTDFILNIQPTKIVSFIP
jgi:nitroimidazol reductase NimA-like FMN-containing flavoprotein (pyridoxamine 5'-phosphate oxidase superfamily)